MANISIISKTSSSVKVRMVNLDTSYDDAIRICVWYANGIEKASQALPNQASSGGAITLSGLEAGKTYTITAVVDADGWQSTHEFYVTVALTETWDWEKTTSRKRAYNAITHQGQISEFTYGVWNEIVEFVNTGLGQKGLSWVARPLSMSGTKMSSTDKVLTAARFNSLKYQVDRHKSTGISNVATGDRVYGEYFITIMDKFNEYLST